MEEQHTGKPQSKSGWNRNHWVRYPPRRAATGGGGMYTVKVWERHLTAKVSDRHSLETTGLHDSGISHVITCLLQLTFLDIPACLRIPFIRLPGPNFNNQVTPFYWTQSFITAITKARHLSLLIRSRHCIHIPLLENIKLTVWTECVRVGRALSFSLKKRKETQRKKKKRDSWRVRVQKWTLATK